MKKKTKRREPPCGEAFAQGRYFMRCSGDPHLDESREHDISPQMNASTQKDVLQHANRRKGERGRAFKSAALIFGGFSEVVIDCLIVEISENGARVETPAMTLVPDLLTLRMRDGTEHRARRAWAKGMQIGLEFLTDGAPGA